MSKSQNLPAPSLPDSQVCIWEAQQNPFNKRIVLSIESALDPVPSWVNRHGTQGQYRARWWLTTCLKRDWREWRGTRSLPHRTDSLVLEDVWRAMRSALVPVLHILGWFDALGLQISSGCLVPATSSTAGSMHAGHTSSLPWVRAITATSRTRLECIRHIVLSTPRASR